MHTFSLTRMSHLCLLFMFLVSLTDMSQLLALSMFIPFLNLLNTILPNQLATRSPALAPGGPPHTPTERKPPLHDRGFHWTLRPQTNPTLSHKDSRARRPGPGSLLSQWPGALTWFSRPPTHVAAKQWLLCGRKKGLAEGETPALSESLNDPLMRTLEHSNSTENARGKGMKHTYLEPFFPRFSS